MKIREPESPRASFLASLDVLQVLTKDRSQTPFSSPHHKVGCALSHRLKLRAAIAEDQICTSKEYDACRFWGYVERRTIGWVERVESYETCAFRTTLYRQWNLLSEPRPFRPLSLAR